MLKKRVIISIILLIVLCLLTFTFVRSGYLPVFGKMIAKSDLEAYTGKSVSVNYNSKYECYVGVDPDHNTYDYDLRTLMIKDESYSDKVYTDINQKYDMFLESCSFDTVSFPEIVHVSVSIDANNHSNQYVWIGLYGVKEYENLSFEETKDRMGQILESFCSTINHNVTSIMFEYGTLNGSYRVYFDNGRVSILDSEWKDHIEKIPR